MNRFSSSGHASSTMMASEAGETLSRNDRQDQSRRMFRMFGIVIQRLVSLLHARRSQDRFSRVEIPVEASELLLAGLPLVPLDLEEPERLVAEHLVAVLDVSRAEDDVPGSHFPFHLPD